MKLQLLVEEVLRTRWLKLAQESALARALTGRTRFSAVELRALIDLQKALQTGQVLMGTRKQCVNVMEELVRDAIVDEVGGRHLHEDDLPDLGDVAAYALSRLPARYATTREGYEHHLAGTRGELGEAVRTTVAEAVDRVLSRPVSRPDGHPLGTTSDGAAVARAVAAVTERGRGGE